MKKQLNRSELLGSLPVKRAVLMQILPAIASQMVALAYGIADTYFVGLLNDPDKTAAVTVANAAFLMLTALSNLFGIGGASLISRSLGIGNRKKAASCSSFCIWTAAGAAMLYGIAILFLRPCLLPVIGADSKTWNYCSDYIFWTICIGAVPTVLNPALAHLIRSEGYSKQASLGVAFGGILNILLDPLFIFVFDMEIQGAAIATMLSNTAASIYFILFICKKGDGLSIRLSPKCYTLTQHIPADVLSVGLPSFMISMMATVSNTALNRIIAAYSTEAVAGMGIAKKIDMLAFAMGQGMSQGALPLIGYNFSSGNRTRMKSALRALLIDCLVVSAAGTALLFFGANAITKCFIDNAATVHHGCVFLKIICFTCLTTTLNFFVITLFQATGKKVQPIILSLLRKGIIDIPLMILFNSIWGVDGIAVAIPVSDFIALVVALILVLPYLKEISGTALPLDETAGNLPHRN
ncbi:MAG TPA: MATE family efflux transporter [Clostridiales bacterium]|nr:MATE family efflux transporter [Clostridiales bacterium]